MAERGDENLPGWGELPEEEHPDLPVHKLRRGGLRPEQPSEPPSDVADLEREKEKTPSDRSAQQPQK